MIHNEGELVKLVEDTNKKLNGSEKEEVKEFYHLLARPVIGTAARIAARQAAKRTAKTGLRKELQTGLEKGIEKGVEKGTKKGMEMGVDKAKEYLQGNPEDPQNVLPVGADQQDLRPTFGQKASGALVKGMDVMDRTLDRIPVVGFVNRSINKGTDALIDRGEKVYDRFRKK